MNVDKKRVFESFDIARVRKRVKGWKHLTLLLHFSWAKMCVVWGFTIRPNVKSSKRF